MTKAIITKSAYDKLIELAQKYAPKIICGFLVGSVEGETLYINEVRQVLTRTRPRFHFKPNWYNYNKILSEIKEEGKKTVGEFHSHPFGSPELNMNDRKILRYVGSAYWIITTKSEVVLWYFKRGEKSDHIEKISLGIE